MEAPNSKLDASRFSFKCSKCKLVCPTSEAFTEHKRESHPYRGPQRSQGSVSLVLQHLQEFENKKCLDKKEKERQTRTPCQICNRRFSSSEDLRQHISSDHHPSLLVDAEVEGEEKEVWLIDEHTRTVLRMYAQVALDYYNNQNLGKRYALVEHGPNVSTGRINHINFKAKEENCPGAPVETFFAQLTHTPFMRVDCCVSLGPSHMLPYWREAEELNGCRFCRPMIKHPRQRVANLILDPYGVHF